MGFDLFPMTAQTARLDDLGRLEFRFTAPEDVAFFQLRAE